MTVTFWALVMRKSNSSVYEKTEHKTSIMLKKHISESSLHQSRPHLTLDDEVWMIETFYDSHLMLQGQFRILLDHVGEGFQAYSDTILTNVSHFSEYLKSWCSMETNFWIKGFFGSYQDIWD